MEGVPASFAEEILWSRIMNELFDVSGKVIVVTGATGILAGGTAQYLQKNGARIVYLGRNQERVNNAVAEAKAIFM